MIAGLELTGAVWWYRLSLFRDTVREGLAASRRLLR